MKRWTTALPEESGYYWLKREGPNGLIGTEICMVRVMTDTLCVVVCEGTYLMSILPKRIQSWEEIVQSGVSRRLRPLKEPSP